MKVPSPNTHKTPSRIPTFREPLRLRNSMAFSRARSLSTKPSLPGTFGTQKTSMRPLYQTKVIRQQNTKAKVEPSTTKIETRHVTINGRTIEVPYYYSVLDACKQADVFVPTLCNHPRLAATGTCRMCLVETSNSDKTVPACVTPVTNGLEVITRSKNLDKVVRGNLELMLSRHPNACMTCEADGQCEFQDLIKRYEVADKWPKKPFTHEWDSDTANAESIVRDLDKCIYCGRCVQACSALQGMNIVKLVERGETLHQSAIAGFPLSTTDCIDCGQCSLYCPVGAITPKPQYHEVMDLLQRKQLEGKTLVVQTAPAVRVALGEEIGIGPGKMRTGQMVSALRRMGFDYVFDTQFSADLTIMEESSELLQRLEKGGPFPMFTSCCPGWVTLVEKCYPEYIPNLSSAKSPQQMLGALAKTYFAEKIGKDPEEIKLISVMPCTAKKYEANRPEMRTKEDSVQHVDYVLTTRELGKILRLRHENLASLEDGEYDDPLGISTGAGVIFGTTGGVMEAALRTAYELATKEPLHNLDIHGVRGLEGVKQAEVEIGDKKLRVCVVNGTANARHLLEDMKAGKVGPYHFIEVMACPGGCIGGGGQPKSKDPAILHKRMEAIYAIDERSVRRKSHENPAVQQVYSEYLGEPLGYKSHELLHTSYIDRKTTGKS